MLRIAPFPADANHVVPLEIHGKLSAQDAENVVAKVEERAASYDTLRLYVEIHSLGTVSPQPVLSGLKDAVKHWRRFEKVAIVTDNDNLRKAVDFTDKVAPGTKIRSAAMEDREATRL